MSIQTKMGIAFCIIVAFILGLSLGFGWGHAIEELPLPPTDHNQCPRIIQEKEVPVLREEDVQWKEIAEDYGRRLAECKHTATEELVELTGTRIPVCPEVKAWECQVRSSSNATRKYLEYRDCNGGKLRMRYNCMTEEWEP